MLPGPGRELAVDGGKALRLAAVIAATVLGLATLPDLLRAPEPPPLPADVGFRPSEIVPGTPPSIPEHSGRKASARTEARRPRNPRERLGRSGGEKGRRDNTREREGARPDPPSGSPPPSVTEAPAAPPPLPAPIATPVPVAPPDGSQEFAPGG